MSFKVRIPINHKVQISIHSLTFLFLGSISLFTKERKLPVELRMLPYDLDSVLHFGERDYSKNGHRTIIFKVKYCLK